LEDFTQQVLSVGGEGRLRLWNRSYAVLFMVNILVSMTLYMTNTCMAGYLVGKGIAVTLAGTILGVMSIASMVTRPFSGFVCDRYRHKRLLLVFLALNALVLFGYGVASTPAVFIALRLLHGVAFGMTTTVMMAYVTSYIPKGHMSEGMGYFGLGQSIAAAIGPSLGLWLTGSATGGNIAFIIGGVLLLMGIAVVGLLLPEHRSEGASAANGAPIRLGDFIAKPAIPYAIITLALSAANGIETSYIATYGKILSLENAGWYFTISAITLFAARILFGRITDRKGFSWALYPGMLMIAAAFTLLAFAPHLPVVPVFGLAAVIKACGVGLLQPAIQSMCVQAVPEAKRGAASSTYYIGTDLGQGASTMTAGQLIPSIGYANLFLVFLIPIGLVTGYYTALRARRRKTEQTAAK
jgi:MFS family permease